MANSTPHDLELGYDDNQPSELDPLLAKDVEALDAKNQRVAELGGDDVVQFSAPIFYADEEEIMMKIDVIRLGTMGGKLAVNYCTADGSAKSSVNYGSVSDQLVFRDGETMQSFEVPIYDDGKWSPAPEFSIQLLQPQNCKLGLYLHTCRVKILNSEVFPTDAHKLHVQMGKKGIETIPDWSLFLEYCKLNLQCGGVRWASIITIILDLLSNCLVLAGLSLEVYIVDTLFARGVSASNTLIMGDQYHTALLIGGWFVLLVVMLHLFSVIKIYVDITGRSCEFLQIALVKTYLNYSRQSREEVHPTRMQEIIQNGAATLAAGYQAMLNIFKLIGNLVAIEVFFFLFQPEPVAMIFVLLIVLTLIAVAFIRSRHTQHAQEIASTKAATIDMLVAEICNKFSLVAAYSKRPAMADMFTKAAHDFTEAKVPESFARLNSGFIAKFLSGSVTAVYFVVNTPKVLSHTLSLGIFLATVTIFSTQLAEAIVELNEQLVVIVETFPSVREFTTCLNLPSELPALKMLNRKRRKSTIDARDAVMMHQTTSLRSQAFMSDLIKLAVRDLSFEYTLDNPVFHDVNLEISQGEMLAVVGPHKSGKATFLDLLANFHVPRTGDFMVPSYLRVLYISREAIFLQSSVLANLCLGLPSSAPIDLDRICSILAMCDLTEFQDVVRNDARQQSEMDKVDLDNLRFDHVTFNDSATDVWEKPLSQSQRIKLHVARALIANAEVIIMQRTLEGLSEVAALEMLGVFRKHVKERGLCLPADTRASRRPRTVLFSTESDKQAHTADAILEVDPARKSMDIVQVDWCQTFPPGDLPLSPRSENDLPLTPVLSTPPTPNSENGRPSTPILGRTRSAHFERQRAKVMSRQTDD